MKAVNTNWSEPTNNIFHAMINLRSALSNGYKAELIQMYNEDCAHPIRIKNKDNTRNFKEYKFTIGYRSTYNEILNNISSPYNKEITLNYLSCYGTQEAVKHYYETGKLSMDNLRGIGKSHLVKVDDAIKLLTSQPSNNIWAHERAASLYSQYRDPNTHDQYFMFDFFTIEHGNKWTIKKFDHKLWVVNLLDDSTTGLEPNMPFLIKILNIIIEPLLFIMKYQPKKTILNMKDYKLLTYRIGGVINGFSIQFHIPRKFNLK